MKIKINEAFKAVQGEGVFAGLPVYFIRTSGCNLNCDFCDTKYHNSGEMIEIEKVVDKIRDSKLENIVFTGGEPMLHIKKIYQIMNYLPNYNFQLETNGSIYDKDMDRFDIINCSPKKQAIKNLESYKKINNLHNSTFKFVYENKNDFWWENFSNNLKIDKKKIWIMPEGATRKEQIKKMPEVMEYCLKNNYHFSPRLHVLAYDTRRGV